LAQQLNLTAAQRAELQQIVANTFDAMQGILTPEQQQTLGNGIIAVCSRLRDSINCNGLD